MRIPNILPMLLLTWSLAAQNAPCHIYDLTAQVVDCANGQFYVTLNFQHENTGDLFRVQGNGIIYDTFPYSQVPVTIGPLAANGTTSYEFVVRDLAHGDCQASIQLGKVTCPTTAPCEVYDLVASAGDCTSDSTYQLKLNFKVQNPTNDSFDLWGNGHFIGSYNLSQVPLAINNFPEAPGGTGYVKVCMRGNDNCCRIYQFVAPICPTVHACEISDIAVQPGACNDDGTYKLSLNFKVANPGNDLFEVWAGNGKYLGNFPLKQLPVTLLFPWGGGAVDAIKICINDNPNCCKYKEFPAPACFSPCEIRNLRVETGDCTSDSTYGLTFKFTAPAGVDSFSLYTGSGQFLGNYATAALPVHLSNFPWGGGSIDAIKICISNTCCRTKEFNAPACIAPACGIADLKVETGPCSTPKTYKVVLNFKVLNPNNGAVKFEVWADNGTSLGTHALSELPLSLDFPWNGDEIDGLKVCLLDSAGHQTCCKIIQFAAPDCVGVSCGIFNLTAVPGDCNPDGTYNLTVNFVTPAANADKFGIWSGTGQFFGYFTVADLPVKIKNFKPSGASVDKIIICFTSGCCRVKEFNAPDCAGNGCGIVDLAATPGDCNPDGTYALKINFQLATVPPNDVKFEVFADNGQSLGTYAVSSLPVVISHFPWNGNAVDAVKICIGNTPNSYCCRVKEFKAPDCTGGPCGIFNLAVTTGDCNDDGTYAININFQTTSAAGVFTVTAGNGQLLGSFPLSALPVHIQHFPGNGGAVDVVKVCLLAVPGSTTTLCCVTKEFKAPDCAGNPCHLQNLTVSTGDCTSDSTYKVGINFQLSNPTLTTQFAVYANGELLGTFPLSALPLTIPNFPTNGGPNDVVKVCIVTPLAVLCCETKEFPVPDCINNGPCEVYNLKVETGDCSSDSTYKVVVNFKVQHPGSAAKFGVWANGKFLGYYALSALPLSIPNFPWSGNPADVIKVCVINSNTGALTCCATADFKAPSCLFHPCDIYDLTVQTGKCNDDGSAYEAWINFKVANPPAAAAFFGVWANNHFIGFFKLSDLPLYIPKFPTDGGPNDVVKVCLSNSGAVSCCETKEFPVPDCVEGPCEIYDVAVTTGDCTSDSTYALKLDFKVQNPGNTLFEVWAGNGKYLGYFKLSDLPLTINKFPWAGGTVDVIKICINDNANCCRTKEFKVPDCLLNHPCNITNLSVQTGDCNADGTYNAWINFTVNNPGVISTFGVWANGKFLGVFPLSALPYHIEHFPTDGGPNDVVKVCLLPAATANPLCCETKEFAVPDCVQSPCEIVDLKVETGDCNADGTYNAWVNFKTNNPGTLTTYGVWANGTYLGAFPLSGLPLHIEHFPTDGGPNDVVKVCLLSNASNVPPCCATKEFAVPDCVGGSCSIYDLTVAHTPCLCGQFFAIVNFKFKNGGSGGFDIVGNGVNYGNFPYNHAQPIILGPLNGDGTTKYEFVVRDHNHPDCQDAVVLGAVDCNQPTPGAPPTSALKAQNFGKLTLAPNPASSWISVTATLSSGTAVGQAALEIRQADGRLVRTLVIPDGSNFQLDVSELQAGVYRLSLQTAAARLESTFAKQ